MYFPGYGFGLFPDSWHLIPDTFFRRPLFSSTSPESPSFLSTGDRRQETESRMTASCTFREIWLWTPCFVIPTSDFGLRTSDFFPDTRHLAPDTYFSPLFCFHQHLRSHLHILSTGDRSQETEVSRQKPGLRGRGQNVSPNVVFFLDKRKQCASPGIWVFETCKFKTPDSIFSDTSGDIPSYGVSAIRLES